MGISKGKKEFKKESNIQCALREFLEETDLKRENIGIYFNINPFNEIFNGSNNLRYKHIYYIAKLKQNIELKS